MHKFRLYLLSTLLLLLTGLSFAQQDPKADIYLNGVSEQFDLN